MTKHAFEKIKQGLDSARAFLAGTADKSRYRVHLPPPPMPTVDEMSLDMERTLYRPGASDTRARARPTKAAQATKAFQHHSIYG
jgi:hypothetical protein